MSERPKVSLIMKVYNGEKYLSAAIDSILSQTYKDYELLIIDDGSTDGSVDIVKGYTDERIRFLQNEHNMGLCKTQNRAMGEARGEYIAIMDCDDISYPDRFARQVAYLDEHPDTVMCGSYRKNIIDDVESDFLPVREYTSETLKFSLCFGNMFFTHSSIMFRGDVCRDNGLMYGPAKLAEDYQFIIRISQYGKIALLPDILIAYRIYSQSTSNVRKQELTNQAVEIRKDYVKSLGLDEKNTDALLLAKAGEDNFDNYVNAMRLVAGKLGADVSWSGNTYDVACDIVRDYLLSCTRYSMKLYKKVKKQGFGDIFKRNRILAVKLYVACLLGYARKDD